jgi:hypothetical protein|tara:strand:+ start:8628 stop:8864 length:237 start_codon:yes stop_codon:yes gene_type:complete
MATLESITAKVWEFVNVPVDVLNNLMTATFPKNEVMALFAISILIGLFMKKRYKVGKVEFVILSLMTFGFARYLGLGG